MSDFLGGHYCGEIELIHIVDATLHFFCFFLEH